MKKNFFRKSVNKNSVKDMFNFLKNHYKYNTLNSWNGLKSIANNVKLYGLELEGDYWSAYKLLMEEEYFTINDMIGEFEFKHPDYKVYFNGRSGGYLVLYNANNNGSILPDYIEDYQDYEDFKQYYVKEYNELIKDYKQNFQYYTQLVQDFDELCDDLRLYCNELSLLKE